MLAMKSQYCRLGNKTVGVIHGENRQSGTFQFALNLCTFMVQKINERHGCGYPV